MYPGFTAALGGRSSFSYSYANVSQRARFYALYDLGMLAVAATGYRNCK